MPQAQTELIKQADFLYLVPINNVSFQVYVNLDHGGLLQMLRPGQTEPLLKYQINSCYKCLPPYYFRVFDAKDEAAKILAEFFRTINPAIKIFVLNGQPAAK